jgi:hypothetical protein
MPAFLENKLKAEYGATSPIVYKVLNRLGALRGSRETAKGRAMQAKHDRDVGARRAKPGGRLAAVMGKS